MKFNLEPFNYTFPTANEGRLGFSEKLYSLCILDVNSEIHSLFAIGAKHKLHRQK